MSGDSSCADHNIAWRVRHLLELDYVPAGVSPNGDDNVIYDVSNDADGHAGSAGGFGHPDCGGGRGGDLADPPRDSLNLPTTPDPSGELETNKGSSIEEPFFVRVPVGGQEPITRPSPRIRYLLPM